MNISGKQYYFGPYLWSTTLPQDLIDELLVEGRKSVQDHVPSLAGIIESEKGYDESYRHVFAQKIQPYVSQYLNNCGKYLKQSNQRFKFLKQVNLMSLWCNFMKKGECNPPHIHDGDLSFVIFLKVPKEIKKECDEYRGRSSGPGCIEFSYGEFHPNITTKNSFLGKTKPSTIMSLSGSFEKLFKLTNFKTIRKATIFVRAITSQPL